MGTIATATYGRSEMGLRNLKSNLQSNCSVMIKRLTGDEYKNMINTIRTYWAGADADDPEHAYDHRRIRCRSLGWLAKRILLHAVFLPFCVDPCDL